MLITVPMKKAPLETLMAQKVGVNRDAFTRQGLASYQLQKLRETICWAKLHSAFYRKRLNNFNETEFNCLADLQKLPFTEADDIREQAMRFLCVSQDDISRVVTLDSSGTTGNVKRIYFTAADQELTINYFQYGMAALVGKGDRVLILFPGERPGGLGQLLATALQRLGAIPIPYGVVHSIPDALAAMLREKVCCLVGIPTQVLALARYADNAGMRLRLQSALLSSDYVSNAIVQVLHQVWGCTVIEHYGMTEMGLGGGTECVAHAGYHLHEADLYFEIVDPQTGEVVPAGQVGEVVVTTLTRQAMPLLRYRTGDISRLLTEPCQCGSILHRLQKIAGRKEKKVFISEGGHFTITDLDETLFLVDGVIDFSAVVDSFQQATKLTVAAVTVGQNEQTIKQAILKALDGIAVIREARQTGKLTISVESKWCEHSLVPRAAKRSIMELKQTDG